ncbi:transcription termination factor Rho [Dietzia kunjamensis]|nr:transcription termination factor Rho [Dietzia kunjamensis]
MRLNDLKSLAQQMGLKGLSGKRKGDLVAMIEGARGGRPAPAREPAPKTAPAPKNESPVSGDAAATAEAAAENDPARDEKPGREGAIAAQTESGRRNRGDRAGGGAENSRGGSDDPDSGRQGDRPRREDGKRGGDQRQGRNQQNRDQQHRDQQGGRTDQANQGGDQGGNRDQQGGRGDQGNQGGRNRDQQGGRGDQGNQGGNRNDQSDQGGGDNGPRGDGQNRDDDGGGRGRRSRRRRERNRGGGRPSDGDTEVREDDVLQPVAGILDVLDNYAFVRTSGYLAGSNDVYVSMNMIRRHGLRRGDAITGAVKMPRDGQNDGQGGGGQGGGKNRQKFNPLVRIDTVNGGPVDQVRNRPDFSKLTPLYPNQRLRLETEKNIISTRVIDLIMPIGKGQRALIVSPPKAGKTTILQNIANAIATNNPECHLMVVLVDERPEEVTDMQRSVKGEVIASTFDRPPSDHTQVAELAIERAKRLVEMGQDVVVLLDSITRLGRAYNNSSPASGRILSGGVDSTALYPPKRFLGAARNIENGGSLTIIATAMVETGSAGDTVIFEEFKGTGNAELKLDRRIAERRVFPAVDVGPSGTRKEELLMSPEEAGIMHKLRRVLSGLDTHQAIDLLMSQLRKTNTNYEFLLQVAKTTPTLPQDEE